MSAVVDFVSDTVSSVGDAVGDVVSGAADIVSSVVDNVVEPIADTVSNVVDSAMQDPLGTIAKVTTAIVAPELLPLVSAADTVANGGDLGDALKSAATTYVAQGVGNYVNTATDVAVANNFSPESINAAGNIIKGSTADIAGNVLGSTTAGIIRGQDPLSALTSSGIGAATSAITSQIDGFSNLPAEAQKAVNIAVSSTLSGQDPSQALINSALNAGIAEMVNSVSGDNPYSGGGNYSGYTTGSSDNLGNTLGNVGGYDPSYNAPQPSTPDILDQLYSAGLSDIADQYAMGDLTDAEAQQYLTGNLSGNYTAPSWSADLTTATPVAPLSSDPYSLWTQNTEYDGTVGLNPYKSSSPDLTLEDVTGKAPDLASMGGGQGLLAPTTDANGNTGVMGETGFTSDTSSPILGDPNSFINNPSYTGTAAPAPSDMSGLSGTVTSSPTVSVKPTDSTSKPTGSTTGSTSNTNPFAIPWLDTKAKMLTSTGKYQPLQEQQLQQIYSQLTPEMQHLLTGGRVSSYADGSTVQDTFKTISDQLASLTPKFAPVSNTVLNSASKGSPLTLAALRQIKQSMTGMARGGLPDKYHEAAPEGHNPEFITGLTGYYAQGKGTGQSDDIPAMLHDGDYVLDADTVASLGDGSSKAGAEALQKFQGGLPHAMSEGGTPVAAKIADGEYVLPESFVTALGGGDNKHGAKLLDLMRKELRAHKRSAPTSKIPPKAKSPLEYLKQAKG